MGGTETKEIHHFSAPDPAQIKLMEELRAQISSTNTQLEEARKAGDQAKEEVTRLNTAVGEMQNRHNELQQQLQAEQAKYDQLINQYRQETAVHQQNMDAMKEELKKMDIQSMEDIERVDKARFDKIMKLCEDLPPIPLQGINIGFFGNTSVGKSSLINSSVGRKVCEVGVGETTIDMKPYRKENSLITYWDIPGKNDRISYLSADFVGSLKAMSFIGIMVRSTTKEMAKITDILNFLKIKFYIIVNYMDIVLEDAEEQYPDSSEQSAAAVEKFKTQIRDEMSGNALCHGIFFVSVKKKSGDWMQLLDAMTNATAVN